LIHEKHERHEKNQGRKMSDIPPVRSATLLMNFVLFVHFVDELIF